MNFKVHVFCKMIFSNKFRFNLETVFSYTKSKIQNTPTVHVTQYCSNTVVEILGQVQNIFTAIKNCYRKCCSISFSFHL